MFQESLLLQRHNKVGSHKVFKQQSINLCPSSPCILSTAVVVCIRLGVEDPTYYLQCYLTHILVCEARLIQFCQHYWWRLSRVFVTSFFTAMDGISLPCQPFSCFHLFSSIFAVFFHFGHTYEV